MRRIIITAIVILSTIACTPTAAASAEPAAPTTTTTAPAATGKDPCAKGDKPCWTEHIRKRRNERAWWLEVRAQQVRERDWNRFVAHLAAQERAASLHGYPAPHVGPDGFLYGSMRCGGDLPTCKIMHRESGGALNKWNGCGGGCHHQVGRNTASGKWQFVRGTWGRFMGYANAADAPEWVQDLRARIVWNHGRGCSNWSC